MSESINTNFQHIELERLEEIGMGDPEFTRELIDMMLADSTVRIDAMRQALTQSAWAELGREAHALKGAALNVGAPKLAELCAQIDDIVRSLNGTIEESMLANVEHEYENVAHELQRALLELEH